MHIYHFINYFDSLYGKKHRNISFRFYQNLIYVTINYHKSKEERETVMLRIWVNKKDTDFPQEYPEYEFILWKNGIYINEYVMPNKEKQTHFYRTREKLITCRADFIAGFYPLELLDNKLLRRLYWENHNQMLDNMKSLSNPAHTAFGKEREYWAYTEAMKDTPFLIEMERYFHHLIRERNLPDIPVPYQKRG